MENQELHTHTNDKQEKTSWLVSCTKQEKELFQKTIAESKQTAPEFLKNIIESSKLNMNIDPELDKDPKEADSYIERLSRLIRSKIYHLNEKEKILNEEKGILQKQKIEIECDWEREELAREKEFHLKSDLLDKEYLEKEAKLTEVFQQKKEELNQFILTLKEENDAFQAKLLQKEREFNTLQKQYSESLRMYEMADANILDLRREKIVLEEKLKYYEVTIEKNKKLELINAVLEAKMEALKSEESLKREYLEKDLKREFEFIVQKNLLNSNDPLIK